MTVNIDFVKGSYTRDYSSNEKKTQSGMKAICELVDNKKREFEKDDLIHLELTAMKPKIRKSFKVPAEAKRRYVKSFRKPADSGENEHYNLELKGHYIDSIKEPEEYGNRRYKGFLFEKGRLDFEEYLVMSPDQQTYFEQELVRVQNFLEENNKYFFAQYEAKKRNEILSEETIVRIIHVDQVKKYYKFLKTRFSNKEDEGSDSTILQFENKFNTLTEKEVYNYFKNELVEKYLSDDDLKRYLFFAFEKCEAPKDKFTLKNSPTAKKIVNVFFKFYHDFSNKPYGKKRHYAALLGDYFKGFTTQKVFDNFE